MRQKLIMIAFAIIAATILIGIYCIGPVFRLNSFYNAEYHAISSFDALNSELFATIPTPKGVMQLEQSSNGIISPSPEHGRYLRTEYSISQTQPVTILDHFEFVPFRRRVSAHPSAGNAHRWAVNAAQK